MSQQLALELALKESTTFANYYCNAKNKQLAIILQEVARGRGEQFIYLWGPTGVGKTHLLQACCHVADKLRLSPIYLPFSNIDILKPEMLEGLETLPLACIDDIDKIAGKPSWEEAFFYFFNRMRDSGKRLIIAGRVPPNELGIALHDLASRLAWGIVFQIQPLSDEEKIQAILLRAKARGLEVPDSVVQYLIKHWPRDMSSLFEALEKLDEASLIAKRKLTVRFVKEILTV
ncbi:MAG: DnaA regulatory inactivator Hda [Gammaproteobacteria bacterium RIFCSPHIGHO2_12_FULL_35_23]|nr:MAG: DnaA regulatory inactivator Hda [Gammaproteobacteria bacterium RIFCSPHIGHO2_12_FULL_35_23]